MTELQFSSSYEVGQGARSYYQAAEILSNATDKKIDYVNVPDDVTRRAMKDMGVDDWPVSTMSQKFDLYRKVDASQVSSRVEEIIERKPISFSQFAKDYAQALK